MVRWVELIWHKVARLVIYASHLRLRVYNLFKRHFSLSFFRFLNFHSACQLLWIELFLSFLDYLLNENFVDQHVVDSQFSQAFA